MCGLFGFSGDPKIIDRNIFKAIQAKVKILGLYNMERGRHSCGIYMDNQILKGVDDDKEFSSFIQNNQLPDATQSGIFTVIGHTRWATTGSHTYENAHPFVVDKKFIMAHNGTIKNIWTLCNKYGIEHSNIHVDSLGLAHLINKKGFSILNEYEGFAALLMAKADEPNSLYVYRGISKRTWNGDEEEERPMFYMPTEEGIYLSSLEKSLLSISDSSSDRVKQLEGNIVHKITNGRMTKSKFIVTRGNVNVGFVANSRNVAAHVTHPPTQGVTAPANITTYGTNHSGSNAVRTNNNVDNSHNSQNFATSSAFDKKPVPMIWHETLPSRISRYKNQTGVFYHLGRYWIITKDSEILLAHGEYNINKKGIVKEYREKDSGNYCFYEGILMKNVEMFKAAVDNHDLKDVSFNFSMMISKYSDIPVCNTRSDIQTRCRNASDYHKYRWYLNDNGLRNYGFTPKWSDRNYRIADGLIAEISMQPGHNRIKSSEITIDKQSLEAERNGGKQETKKFEVPVLSGPSANPINQSIIPFKEIVVNSVKVPEAIIKEQGKDDWDFAHFYRTYNTIEEARSIMSELELNALRYYICDIMAYEMDTEMHTIHDDFVDVQLNVYLATCIDSGVSIYDNWDETNYGDIIHYLTIAEENPDGIYRDEAPVDDCACEVVLKPIPQVEDNTEAETPVIDIAIAREMAVVPKGDVESVKVEPVTSSEERDYAIEDIVDYAGTVRDSADELTAMEDDDFAQDVAGAVYSHIDPLYHDLKEICEKHGQQEYGKLVANQMKAKLGL